MTSIAHAKALCYAGHATTQWPGPCKEGLYVSLLSGLGIMPPCMADVHGPGGCSKLPNLLARGYQHGRP